MPQGVPCLYPNFHRYEPYGYGRHSGPVWPHVQAFWADACAKYAPKKFFHELEALSQNAVRDGYFSEIYHPYTGERYSGVQEWQGSIVDTWKSEKRQMWCATGYIRMILFDLLGMRFAENGITVFPKGKTNAASPCRRCDCSCWNLNHKSHKSQINKQAIPILDEWLVQNI